MQELDSWAEYILNYEGLVFQINAYADFRGKDNYNVELSMNRALACKKYLVDNKGVDKDRILITAKGEKDPYVMDLLIELLNAPNFSEQQRISAEIMAAPSP